MKDKPDPRYTITPEIIKDIEEILAKGKTVQIATNKDGIVFIELTAKRKVYPTGANVRQ